MKKVSDKELFFTFFKIGAFTFGGGYVMLPLIQETVLRNGWLDQKHLIDFIAVSERLHGRIAACSDSPDRRSYNGIIMRKA